MATKERFINIKFPFKSSDRGFFIDMNQTTIEAVKSDLTHLLVTRKGDRVYKPDFGTNLMSYIFEPNDDVTIQDVRNDIEDAVNKFIPGLRIDELNVVFDEENEHKITVKVNFTITDGVFESSDYVEITF